jgi:hypothetical protein
MWKTIVRYWKDEIDDKEFSKELDKHFWKPNPVILYFVVLLAILIGLIIKY